MHQRTVDAEWNVIVKDPKGTSRRTIHLGPATAAALRRRRAQSAAERLLAGETYVDNGLVFVHGEGSAYHPDRLTRMFRRVSAEAKVPLIRLHDARHSCATLALADEDALESLPPLRGEGEPPASL